LKNEKAGQVDGIIQPLKVASHPSVGQPQWTK